jgi:3-oxoacyl-[acyl-carrier-protein] synthase II
MTGERRVVVTGLGVATPIGIGIDAFWEALIQKRCGIGRVQAFDASGLPAQIAGELPPFTLSDFVPKSYRKSAKVMARDISIAVVCAYGAVRDAGLITKCIVDRGEATGAPNVESERLGANIGAGLICADLGELAGALATAVDEQGGFSLARWGGDGMSNLTPLWLLKFLPNMLACHVTIVHGARAPSNTITCAEASSHLAVGEAFRTIARGDADVCLCGGAESKVNPMAMARPILWSRLATDANEDPGQGSRPFGARRSGMVASEGGGLLILESLEHARRRGARVYAEVLGFGAGTDGTSWSTPDPKGEGIALALRHALADANVRADQIDLAAPFGTGTVEHDVAEIAAWNSVLGDRLGDICALTTRGAVGNNGAGTGGIDLAATVSALYQNTVPPSFNTQVLDPACRFQFVQEGPVDANVEYAISTGYALAGGQSAALVIRRYRE